VKFNTRQGFIEYGLTLALGLAWGAQAWAQERPATESPEDVLKAYRKMDVSGGRLTETGWYQASKFFVRPERLMKQRAFQVIDGERFDGVRVYGAKTLGFVLCSGVGQVDSAGRFSPRISPPLFDSHGVPILVPPGEPQISGLHTLSRLYSLVLTGTRWEFGPHGEGPRRVDGPPAWKIDEFEYRPWVTIDVAIDYLTRLQSETHSQVVKKNASRSIAILRELKKE
jgi:hypothetical protein